MRSLFAAVACAVLCVSAAEAEKRVFIIANSADGYGIDRCLASGEACGKAMATALCRSNQFVQAIGMFPTGTLVLLNTGEVAVVTAQSRIRRLRPEIMVILDPDKRPLDEYRVVDLNRVSATADDQASLWIEQGLEPGAFGVDPAEYYLN